MNQCIHIKIHRSLRTLPSLTRHLFNSEYKCTHVCGISTPHRIFVKRKKDTLFKPVHQGICTCTESKLLYTSILNDF